MVSRGSYHRLSLTVVYSLTFCISNFWINDSPDDDIEVKTRSFLPTAGRAIDKIRIPFTSRRVANLTNGYGSGGYRQAHTPQGNYAKT